MGEVGETTTLCAKATGPTQEQQNRLNAIKMIGAIGGIAMQPGVEKMLLDMVTETNAGFDLMVGKKFPRINKKLLRPYHAVLWGS